MSDNIQHIDVDSDDFIDAPKALRDYVKKLQSQNKTLSSDLSTARNQLASQALGDVLSGAGFKNPKRVERDLLSDGIDPHDKSAVEKWLSDNGDDYAKGAVQQAQETPVVTDEEQKAHSQLNLGSEFQSPADMSKIEAAQAEITPGMSGAEITAVLQKHGL